MSPSPDFSGFVDLTVNDQDPQDLFNAAILRMGISLPEWTPNEGNTEVVLLEAFAFEIAELLFAINRLPNAIMEIILLQFGIPRSIGQQPSVEITFTVNDTLGHVIPVGTQLLLSLFQGVDPIVFTTVADLLIAPTSNTGTVVGVGDRYTTDANGTVVGTQLSIMDSLSYVNSATTATIIEDGLNAEADLAWITRGSQVFQQLTAAVVLPRQFQARVLSNPVVSRALAIDNYNPSSGNLPGADPGNITIAIYGQGSVVSDPNKAVILSDLQNAAMSALSIHLINPTLVTVNVTAQILVQTGYNPTLAIANAAAAINNYLSVENWNWGNTVFRNQLIRVLSEADGVDYVVTLNTPIADQVLSSVAPLAVAGTITISAA